MLGTLQELYQEHTEPSHLSLQGGQDHVQVAMGGRRTTCIAGTGTALLLLGTGQLNW